jgi:serine/threonine-protein kinase RsbW
MPAALALPKVRKLRITHPAVPIEVPAARHQVADFLAGCPRQDDAELVVSELAGNAVRHSRSKEPGGTFTVFIEIHSGDYVWIECLDAGGPWCSPAPGEDWHGLDLVNALTCGRRGDWGIDDDVIMELPDELVYSTRGRCMSGRIVWARLDLLG